MSASIGERLRIAREASGQTLEEIAATTRINKKYLSDLEQGKPIGLPETYLRAFVKAYAREVGLDPAELLAGLPRAAGERPMPQPEGAPAATLPPRAPLRPIKQASNKPAIKTSQKVLMAFIVLGVVIGLVTSIVWLRSERNDVPVEEISFSDVLREQNAQLQSESPIQSLMPDSTRDSTARTDSLRLEAAVTESVWVRVVIDGGVAKEYTLTPAEKMRWKAKEYYLLSVGNPSGVMWKLNGYEIGALGKGTKPLWNASLSWRTLDTIPKSVPASARLPR